MSSPLSKRRKNELKELATSLGLSDDGIREDLVDRIRAHIAKHGASDPSLRDLVREDSPGMSTSSSRRSSITEQPMSSTRRSGRRSTEINRLASLSSATEDGEETSDGPRGRSGRSSKKKSGTTRTSQDSDSESAEDPLSEHQVKNFMTHVREELGEAKGLAHSLEHSLQEKVRSGRETLRRASKDFSSTVSHALGSMTQQGESSASGKSKTRRGSSQDRQHHSHHRRHSRQSRNEDEDGADQGWFSWTCEGLRSRFVHCAEGGCSVSTYMHERWKRLHDMGSTSAGFVWITFSLELTAFLCAACPTEQQHDEAILTRLAFLTNWTDFLKPFFAYYGALFVLPTLLSQLFNVDRSARKAAKHDNEDEASSQHHHHHHHRSNSAVTGLLSNKTTSGLSFFVFKFALAYYLSQSFSVYQQHSGGLADLAKGAAEAFGLGGQGRFYYWTCTGDFLTDVFRYVPASLSLATSGAGAVLALAESVVSRRK